MSGRMSGATGRAGTGSLETEAEVLKLARLLHLDEGELAHLQQVPAAELRRLREKVTDSLFDEGGNTFARLAAGAKLLPSALVATISERSMGPLLCARSASEVEPAKAIDVAKRLSPGFLADTTVELDPRRVASIISGVPGPLVEKVARELGKRREYVTMGRFLAYVPDESIAAAMAALSDEAMLRTAFVLEHKEALDNAVGVLPPERLPGVLRYAAENDLWPEALDLLGHLSDERLGPIADVLGGLGEGVINGLVAEVHARGLWSHLLPVVSRMSQENRAALAGMDVFHQDDVLQAIVEAVAESGLWLELAPLLSSLPAEARATVVQVIDSAGEDLARSLLDALPDPKQVGAVLEHVSDDMLDSLERAADRLGMRADYDQILAAAEK